MEIVKFNRAYFHVSLAAYPRAAFQVGSLICGVQATTGLYSIASALQMVDKGRTLTLDKHEPAMRQLRRST
jgi:hypothetical protein